MDRKETTGSSTPSSAKKSRSKRLSSGVKKFVTGQLSHLANERSNSEQPSGSGLVSQLGGLLTDQGGKTVGSLVGQLESSPIRPAGSELGENQGCFLAGRVGSSSADQPVGQDGQQQGGDSLTGQLDSSSPGHVGSQEDQSAVLLDRKSGKKKKLGSKIAGQIGRSPGGALLARQFGSSLLGAGEQGGSLAGDLGGSLLGQLGGGQQGAGSLAGQLGGSLLGQLGGGQQGAGSLAGQLGGSLLGQLGGQQGAGSLAGQLGGSLLGQLGGGAGQGGSVLGQLGGLAGPGGGLKPPQAGGAQPGAPAGGNPVLSTVACSAVQGLRRAAEAKSIPMKVFWILMVLVSVGMFVQGALDLTNKVRTVQILRTYQMDKVPFVFPDLYFCPKNSYSGSFPYTLNQSQADTFNREVERLSKLYDEQLPGSGFDESSKTKVWLIQQSLPVHLQYEYILHRPKQSLFYPPMISYYGNVAYETVLLPTGVICFKVALTDQDRKVLIRRQNLETLRLALFTDPVFPDFKYSGEQIKPIYNPKTNETIPFRLWYPSGITKTQASGYTMLIVPTGVYPSMEHESKFLLAPGKSYDIDIHMEEHKFSEELWGSHCSTEQKTAEFADHLTGRKVVYNYSYDACYFTEFARQLHKIGGYIQQGFPVSWDLRGSPRWGNLSENIRINRSTMEYGMDLTKADETGDPVKFCNSHQPCVQQKYVSMFSFHNWPSIGASYSAPFQESDPVEQPAIHQLANIAKQLDNGNHSTHSEAALRHFISESMLEVSIRVDNPLAARILMTASYSGTSFLSDIGGLMGLYLGCSALTLCEFVEMFYAKVSTTIKTKCLGRTSSTAGSGKDDGDDDPKDRVGNEADDIDKSTEDETEMKPLRNVEMSGCAAAGDDSNEAIV